MFGLSYWFIPLVAGCVWLGMSLFLEFGPKHDFRLIFLGTLLAMLGVWVAKESPE
jgi:hypothetical protein